MTIAAGVEGDTAVPAPVACLDMAPQCGRATQGQIFEDPSLLGREGVSELLEEGVAVAPEDIGHFEPRSGHERCPAVVREPSRSKGLWVAASVAVETWVYSAVVCRLRCPSRTWMVRRSAPASRRWVAKL
jgi:hypothetical protein